MKYRLQDLIDIEHFQNLQDRLNEIYSFPSSIIDNDGNILTATAWQDICTKFHRKNKDTELLCIKSDQYIQSHIHEANPAVSYRCPHGLVDNATPIIIDGIHYGNFFTGQFFLEEPDLNFFKAQAKKFGFDEEAYLEAVKKVPIWTQDQLENYLFFIKGLIAVISESGLKKLQEMEARKQIEKSEKRHRSILKTAMDGYWLTDTDGRLLEINDTYCDISGYSQDELLTMHIRDLEVSENAQIAAKHMDKVVSQGSDRFESKHRRKDGTILDIEASVQFRPEEGGQCVYFLRDITERKRAEENSLKQKHFLQMAQEIGKIGTWELNIPKNELLWTDENYRIFGLPIGSELKYETFLNCVHPDDRKYVDTEWKASIAGKPYNIEHRLLVNGMVKWVSEKAELTFNEKNECIKGIGFTQDITERKQAEEILRENEEKYRLLFESAGDAIFIHNMQAQILAANPMASKLLGYTNAELTSMTVDQVDTPEQAQHAPDRIARLMEIGHLSFETVHQRKNGSTIPVDVSARRITWKGQPAMMSICRDFTERRQAEDVLRVNEEKYRALIEGLPDIVMRFDRAGRHLFVSDNVSKVVDLPASAFIGKTHYELGFLESQCRFWEESIQKVFESGAPFETEYAFESKCRPVIHNWRLLPEYDACKKVRSVLSISRDITAYRKAEQDYQTLFREMLDGFALHEIICDAQEHPKDYRFLAVNPAFERMTDLKAETIVGRTVMEVMPETEPYWIETYGKVALTGEPAFFENFSTELKKHFEVTAFKPAPNQFACIFADITQRKQAEKEREKLQAQLSNALEMAHLGHWEYDVATDRFTFNDYFYKIFRTKANQVGGYMMSSAEYARRFVHPDEIALVGEENRKAIETDDPFFSRQLEHRMLYADGTVGHIAVKYFIQKDAHGKTVRTFGVNQDITERRQSEEALRVSEEKYRKLVDTAPYGIQLTDLSGKITFSNPTHHKIQGYADGELIGKYIWDLMADDIHREKSKSYRRKCQLDSIISAGYIL